MSDKECNLSQQITQVRGGERAAHGQMGWCVPTCYLRNADGIQTTFKSCGSLGQYICVNEVLRVRCTE